MALSVNLNLTQKQKLVVTQTLREAIELLQISSLELRDRIEQEVEENPVLELSEQENESQPEESAEEPAEEFDDTEMLNLFEDSSDDGFQSTGEKKDPDSKQQFLEGAIPRELTFHEELLNQLRLATHNEIEYQIGEIIISYLDKDGYLLVPIEQVARESADKVDVSEQAIPGTEDFQRIHELIKTFEPAGVGAGDIPECLSLQLKERNDRYSDLAIRIINENFDLLEKHRFKQIAVRQETSQEAVEKAAQLVASLEPKPGRQFSENQVEYVVPDIIVQRDEEGEFQIIINDDWIPGLRVSRYYRNMLKSKKLNKKVKSYINDKYSSAQWLIRSIAQRRMTLYAVMEAILSEQYDFFVEGPGNLKPLTLKDIAERIDMHESTVSRVTSNKYVQSPWGLYGLKYFFSSSIRKTNGQVESSQSVKELIKQIIDSEVENNTVYSDQDIVGILSNRGIKIARRTVAKYRKMLKILPSSRRHSQ